MSSGSDGSTPGKPKTWSETKIPVAERGGEGQDHRQDQQQRRQQRAQQDREDHEHDEERERDDHAVVARRRLAQVVLLRGRAADEHARAARGLDRAAQRGHLVERRPSRRGRGAATTSSRAPGGPCCGGSTWATRSRALLQRRRAPRPPCARSGTITFVGADEPGRERAREDLLRPAPTRPRRGTSCCWSAPCRVCRTLSGEQRRARASRRPRRARGRAADALADAAASGRGSRRCPAAPTCGIVSKNGDQNALRPQIVSSAGSIVSIEIIASADAHRADRAEAGRAVDLGER